MFHRRFLVLLLILGSISTASRPAAAVSQGQNRSPAASPKEMKMKLTLTSPAFSHNGAIPAEYTCDDRNVSPQLAWSGIPLATKSLVLIIEDPDAPDPNAPKMTWTHWILYNIPPTDGGIPKGAAAKHLPAGILEGMGDSKHPEYSGPCPPIGRHRYFHKLYALDTVLPDLKHPTRDRILKAIEGHILASTELVGTYQRSRK